MCNLYSITTNQAAIIALFRVVNRYVGNLAPMPGVFPDYPAPVIRNTDTGRELSMMRWGMPPPPKFGGPPVTNIRNTSSPHWRGWLKSENRCLVPFNSFAEYAPEPNPATKKKDVVWFALNDGRPLCALLLDAPEQRGVHLHQFSGAADAGRDDSGGGVFFEALGVEHAALAAVEGEDGGVGRQAGEGLVDDRAREALALRVARDRGQESVEVSAAWRGARGGGEEQQDEGKEEAAGLPHPRILTRENPIRHQLARGMCRAAHSRVGTARCAAGDCG